MNGMNTHRRNKKHPYKKQMYFKIYFQIIIISCYDQSHLAHNYVCGLVIITTIRISKNAACRDRCLIYSSQYTLILQSVRYNWYNIYCITCLCNKKN